MATVSTLDHLSGHGTLGGIGVGKFAHTSPLPRVFLRVSKEDVLSRNVKATVNFVGLVSVVGWQIFTEHS